MVVEAGVRRDVEKTVFVSKINRIGDSDKIILFVYLLSPKLSVFVNYCVNNYMRDVQCSED